MNFDEIRFPNIGITVETDPIAFHVGSFPIYWYGVIIAAALVLCTVLAIKHAKANKFSEDLVYDVLLCALPCAIVGARLYYVFCEWSYYSQDLSRIFDTRSGGLAVYGGVIGAFLGTYIMCRIRKIPFSSVADYCVVYIPLGQAIGRWGNFFNQEAFGTTTNLPWGMTSDKIASYLRINCPYLDSTMPVHPTFLYESLLTLTVFIILLLVRSKSTHKYEVVSMYMVGYGLARFFLEGLRTDSLYIAGTTIRTSQLLSLILVVAGLLIIIITRYNNFVREPLPERLFIDRSKASVKTEEVEVSSEEKKD
ncbi:MAG: prolipoprotein diacylglyceryl transferase [Saccharofermentans sp.]|nr:prolipoprotein diacylglyceryl transferase [Saccharofermentans sp.]